MYTSDWLDLIYRITHPCQGKDIRYETHLLISEKSTGKNLVRFAEVIKAERIYIGARKRSKAGKFLTGSTTQSVLNAPCPVVTIK
jgi:nucleotide-binding universal stress UspA family protein